MRILYIAIACGPLYGSEDAIGWNFPIAMSKLGHDVFVLTRLDKKEEIEAYLEDHPEEIGPHYIYEKLSFVEGKCNRGLFYSVRNILWCRRVSKLLPGLCSDLGIDVIHQITPVQFRAIVDVGQTGCKSVLGPLGAGEYARPGLAPYLRRDWKVEFIRKQLNIKMLTSKKYISRFGNYSCVAFANKETRELLERYGIDTSASIDITEIGIRQILPLEDNQEGEFHLLFVGRLVPRKGAELLIDVVNSLDSDAVKVRIVGEGRDKKRIQEKCDTYGLTNIDFVGSVPYVEMIEQYAWADCVVMPSLRETGGAVIAEALQYGKPIVTFNAYGAVVALGEQYPGLVSTDQPVDSLKAKLVHWSKKENRPTRDEITDIAKGMLWDRKASYFESLYEKIM